MKIWFQTKMDKLGRTYRSMPTIKGRDMTTAIALDHWPWVVGWSCVGKLWSLPSIEMLVGWNRHYVGHESWDILMLYLHECLMGIVWHLVPYGLIKLGYMRRGEAKQTWGLYSDTIVKELTTDKNISWAHKIGMWNISIGSQTH